MTPETDKPVDAVWRDGREVASGGAGAPRGGGPAAPGQRAAALRADGLLLIVAAIWGSGFVAQKAAMEHMGPMTFTAVRYAIGAAVLVPFLFGGGLGRVRRTPRRVVLAGVGLGGAMFVAAGLQQVGLVTTTASRAGFITGLYVLAVPVVGLFVGERATAGHVVGGVVAVGGLTLLSLGGRGEDGGGGLGIGDLLVCGCAVAWAVHVVLVARVAPRADALVLAGVQFATVAVLGAAAALIFEAPDASQVAAGWLPIAYSGVLVIGVAFTLQIVAQRTAPPMHAAVIMSLEAVFGAACGVWLLGDELGWVEWTGCGLMLAGVVVSQVWPGVSVRLRRARLRDAVR